MTPIRIALIGVGDVAERDYLPEWHRLKGLAELSGVCGRNPERVRRIAAAYGVPRWSTDYLEVVRSDIDTVVNLTPISSLAAITAAALEAGRHVYTEKPLALTSSQARALRDTAARRELVLTCAPSILLFPQIVQVGEILRSGELGVIRSARAHALSGVPPWPGYRSDPTPYFAAAAGPLLDLGVYPLHVLTGLLGPVSSVAASAARSRDRFTVTEGPFAGRVIAVECEDEWHLNLRLANCTASVEASYATVASPAAECELRGDRGAVAFSLLDVSAPISVLRPGAGGWTDVPVEHERDSGPDHVLGIRHLVECIGNRTDPVPSADHAIHVLEVIEAARGAARTGRTVAVPAPPGAELAPPRRSGQL
jgi:predicted dehydrogenase